MNIETFIAERLAAPKAYRVITRFRDGSERYHDTETLGQAENHAVGENRKIGLDLINRDT